MSLCSISERGEGYPQKLYDTSLICSAFLGYWWFNRKPRQRFGRDPNVQLKTPWDEFPILECWKVFARSPSDFELLHTFHNNRSLISVTSTTTFLYITLSPRLPAEYSLKGRGRRISKCLDLNPSLPKGRDLYWSCNTGRWVTLCIVNRISSWDCSALLKEQIHPVTA